MAPVRSETPGGSGTSRARDVYIIGVMMAVIFLMSLLTDTSLVTAHALYRRLYYLPILYAAFIFGMRGGLITSLASAALLVPIAEFGVGSPIGTQQDVLLEVVMYVVGGLVFGFLRDIEGSRAEDLRQLSRELESAYAKLEERAVQLINIQGYTQSILRSITSGVLTIGPDGSVATANPAAEGILGMHESELVPHTLAGMLKEDGGLNADISKILAGRVPRVVHDLTLVSRSGKTVHAQASVSRMRNVEGQTLGAVVTLEDVSEVKALTEQLIRADRLAAMGELTAGVAHEVRNPLGIIRASVQLLEDEDCDSAKVRAATGIVKQEIDRLDNVIKALLDFGRPAPPALAPTDVEEVLREVVLFAGKFASRAEVRVVEEYEGGIDKVLADPNLLKQVFVNLITNAVQAMEPDGGTLKVGTAEGTGFVRVSFADDGPGIAAEDLGKIFDPFYSRRDEGTGLGLTIVHRVVDEHDGHIEVESVVGQGTTFSVWLPAMTVAEAGRADAEERRSL